jgi:large subunit ribosomal protein L21
MFTDATISVTLYRMKKAVITTGGKQYLVAERDIVDIDLIEGALKPLSFESLLSIDDNSIKVGTPIVAGTKVTAEVIEPMIKDDKVIAIRYKAKKRVHKTRGHRQQHTRIKITKIT